MFRSEKLVSTLAHQLFFGLHPLFFGFRPFCTVRAAPRIFWTTNVLLIIRKTSKPNALAWSIVVNSLGSQAGARPLSQTPTPGAVPLAARKVSVKSVG
jgi:hypothetical protein